MFEVINIYSYCIRKLIFLYRYVYVTFIYELFLKSKLIFVRSRYCKPVYHNQNCLCKNADLIF